MRSLKLLPVLLVFLLTSACIKPKCTKHEMYFGRNSPSGEISEQDWEKFVKENIASKLPGFTVWDGKGFWTSDNGKAEFEKSKVLIYLDCSGQKTLLDKNITEIRKEYIREFSQNSVLWTSLKVSQK